MRLHKPLLVVPFLALLALCVFLSAQPEHRDGAGSLAVVEGVSMSISAARPVEPADAPPTLSVSLENVGEEDLLLNLGMMLANGKVHLPDAIRLTLIDSRGRSRDLRFSDKRYAGAAGRIDDYTVPLRAGSTYTVKLSLDDYWCPSTREFRLELPVGQYQVSAHFEGKGATHLNSDTQGMRLMNFWTGELRSNTIGFEIAGDTK